MGYLQPLEPHQGRRRFRVTSPVDGREVGQLECATEADVLAAVARAREVQPAWAATPVSARCKLLRKALQLLVKESDQFCQRLIAETGRTEIETLSSPTSSRALRTL